MLYLFYYLKNFLSLNEVSLLRNSLVLTSAYYVA
jgi:hypothetical protein